MSNQLKKLPVAHIRGILKDISSTFRFINAGGCGVMATILGDNLAPIVQVNARICDTWNSQPRSFNQIIYSLRQRSNMFPTLRQINDEGLNFSHVWVEFYHNGETWWMDAEQLERPENWKYWRTDRVLPEVVLLDDIRQVANQPEGWNQMFDRRCIPNLQAFTTHKFNQLWQSLGVGG